MKFIKIACIIFLVTSITWGCTQSGDKESSGNKQDPKVEKVQPPVLQDAPTGEADKFGRQPGDQHYGHDHAPADKQLNTPTNTQPATPPAGGPDKYGRNPGDQHYGHDHE